MTPVPVTQDDFDNGTPGDGAQCFLALAIKRAIPGADVSITGEQPTINDRSIALTADIIEKIGRYDRGEPVQPFTIYLSGI
jgi:hypothetical protein